MFKKLIMAAVIVGSGASFPCSMKATPKPSTGLSPALLSQRLEVTASVKPQDKGAVSGTQSGRSHKIGMDRRAISATSSR